MGGAPAEQGRVAGDEAHAGRAFEHQHLRMLDGNLGKLESKRV